MQIPESKPGETIAGNTATVRSAAWLSADPPALLTKTVRKIVQFRHLLRSVGLRESPIFHPAILPTEFSIIQAAAPPRLLAKPHSPVSGREYLRSSRTPATLLRASSSNTRSEEHTSELQ